MTTDPFAEFVNNAFTSIEDIFGQHRLYLGMGYTFVEVTPRVFIHFMGIQALQDPTPRQFGKSRYQYKVVIPRATLNTALAATGLDLSVVEKSNDESPTPWAIQEAGDEIIRPVRVQDLLVWEQDNPVMLMRRLWRQGRQSSEEKGAQPWLLQMNQGAA